MGQLASVLAPLGAQLIKGNGQPPTSSSAGLNTAGSSYNLVSGGGNTPLIQNGFSTTQILVIGAVILAFFLIKR